MKQQTSLNYIFKPEKYSSHSVILSWLEIFPIGTKILDIGTATGYIGKMVQHKRFDLSGLEPNAEWVELAKPYYKEINCTNLESADNSYLANFQVVLLADVLEHMPFPEKELKRLISLQPQGGIFIISVPNIANIWIRLQLLFGNFNYMDRGILDKTHLRFFTKSSLLTLLNNHGLKVCRYQATPIPLSLVHPFFSNTLLGKGLTAILGALTRIWPTLLGYQWIAQCEVTNNG